MPVVSVAVMGRATAWICLVSHANLNGRGSMESREGLTSSATSTTAASGSAAGSLISGLPPVGTRANTSIAESCVTRVNHDRSHYWDVPFGPAEDRAHR